jgi:hypothetical protein
MPNYILLERIELNASAASITFSNIPQSGYTDLKIVVSARSDSTTGNFFEIRPNGATTNLSGRYLQGDGSAVNSSTFQPWSYVPPSNSTASTFGSVDIYIPNYSSTSANKSISVDYVTENNATAAFAGIEAGLWSSTSAITSLVFAMSTGNFVANSTFSLYGLAALGTTPVIAPKASGGNITTDGTYWIHTFLTTGAFVPQQGLTCDYLVVAGGGSGNSTVSGNDGGGGGGGAGGLRSTVTATGGGGSLESALAVTSGTSYTITVGAGGAAPNSGISGTNGSNSVFSSITSIGGGGGGSYATGNAGGSGGGGGYGSGSVGGAGTTNQGYAGGTFSPNGTGGNGGLGGGGGAGAVGANGSVNNGGNGGNGVATSISGSSVTYAGGGGGARDYANAGSNGTGGSGGGGAANWNGNGTSGTTNTGGGGGGVTQISPSSGVKTGGNGGSGIVIIRYPIA